MAKKILVCFAVMLSFCVIGSVIYNIAVDTSPGSGTRLSADAGQAAGQSPVAVPSDVPSDEPEDGPVIAQMGGKPLVFEAEQIEVAIGKPGKYKPGKYAEPLPKKHIAFVVTVTLVNKSKNAINADTIVFTSSVGEVNAEAEQIFDSEAGILSAPGTALLPGKTTKFKIGFHAPTSEKNPVINMNVSPWELGLATGLFQGRMA